MGSEMCIRDSHSPVRQAHLGVWLSKHQTSKLGTSFDQRERGAREANRMRRARRYQRVSKFVPSRGETKLHEAWLAGSQLQCAGAPLAMPGDEPSGVDGDDGVDDATSRWRARGANHLPYPVHTKSRTARARRSTVRR